MVGALGSLIFEVSDSRILTFSDLEREISGRWTEHAVIGGKPRPEFLGPGLQGIHLQITLSANLGVRPRNMLDLIARMVETGTAEYFVVGSRPVGQNPFRLTGSSEAWDKIYSGGELAKATVTITLEEYV